MSTPAKPVRHCPVLQFQRPRCVLCSITTSVTVLIVTTDLDQQATVMHTVMATDQKLAEVHTRSASIQVNGAKVHDFFFGVKYFMKVSKPVIKGKYLLLCTNSIMYFPLTSYTLIVFLKVLIHFIMKIKNFMKYFKEGISKYFKFSMKFLNI